MHRHRCCWPPAKITYLVLLWTTVICLCWTSGSAQALLRYPKIDSEAVLVCECHQEICDQFLWFRSLENGTQLFLVGVNTAGRCLPDPCQDRFIVKMTSVKSTLRITKVTREDRGIYSCVSKSKRTEGVWSPGVLLLPGELKPELKPQPTPKEPVCRCREKSHKPQPKGCDSVILWPLVGILAGLALALLSTLYYFSRLPKKCRHHFVKKGQMRLN